MSESGESRIDYKELSIQEAKDLLVGKESVRIKEGVLHKVDEVNHPDFPFYIFCPLADERGWQNKASIEVAPEMSESTESRISEKWLNG